MMEEDEIQTVLGLFVKKSQTQLDSGNQLTPTTTATTTDSLFNNS